MMNRATFLAAAAAVGVGFALTRKGSAAQEYEVTHTDAQWRALLGADRFEIMRRGGTEPPFSSPLNKENRRGTYHCAGCALALFSSATKYDPGEGWPSFWNVLPNAIRTQDDYALIEKRTEAHCRRCGGHLGHIFDDGPPPTHLRYCIDGLALRFVAAGTA
jgi:peptide-methionine (R)-S-oxide reductase